MTSKWTLSPWRRHTYNDLCAGEPPWTLGKGK